ncbi:DNA/RNA helicase domain-containing protein [Pedobacter flavus]|uniref:DNA/RNA helicase domain-containing protein n=1 Tax=Pedobacter flavus TaxID=3113906 RepID=A0ABU7H3D8_9SPHI|nr:DNA/RNA helicase domain-containing protein [Pedobacter sp. VNH31]MEE1885503.1 DNA/RNA helicase domain-containing protein [Pedobacter sp. VNH31]
MKFSVYQYPLDNQLESNLIEENLAYLNYPLVYFLEEDQRKIAGKAEAYVGETTDIINRLKAHCKSVKKVNLKTANLIVSELFNKSATLDLESNLIQYIAADGKYSLQNGNLGIVNHQYYQKREVYWDLFKDIWSELRKLGIARHSLDYLDNSDLFKYSPYKSLSKEQIKGLKIILSCLLDDKAKVSLIQGGAGTGKSILAIFLFKLLNTDLKDFNFSDFDEQDEEVFALLKAVKEKYTAIKMALVIPMASFRQTISNVFKNIKGLSSKMVIGPSEVVKQKYDLLIVDEGHRLRKRQNLGSYYGTFDRNCDSLGLDKINASELDWIEIQSSKSIIFYDQFQSIKPSDTSPERFYKLQHAETTRNEKLFTQFRVKGGVQYVQFIHNIFNPLIDKQALNTQIGFYDFQLFDDLQKMVDKIKGKDKNVGLSRMIAGFAWEWISNKDPEAFDIKIGETQLKWNSTAVDWINSTNAINEVGCIHTTQGYDLNYTGVIIGPELDYDFEKGEFIVIKENYKDKNGKNSIKDEKVLLDYIINIYKTILLRGIEGTYIYVCNKNLRTYLSQFIKNHNAEEHKPLVEVLSEPTSTSVPFYDLSIAAGSFSDFQTVQDIKYIDLPEFSLHQDYFACKVVGESMNKVIPNGSICLFRKYAGGSRNGLITLVEGSSFFDSEIGANYTIKEYNSKKTTDEEGWRHEEITLKPLSTGNFEPIVLRNEETHNFKVIGVFQKVLG